MNLSKIEKTTYYVHRAYCATCTHAVMICVGLLKLKAGRCLIFVLVFVKHPLNLNKRKCSRLLNNEEKNISIIIAIIICINNIIITIAIVTFLL